MTDKAEKIENAYNKLSEAVAELIEAEYEDNYEEAEDLDLDVAAGNVGLYVEVEYKEMLKEKIKQQKEQQEKEQMYKELSEMVDIIYNAKNEQEAIEKLEKLGVKGYRM